MRKSIVSVLSLMLWASVSISAHASETDSRSAVKAEMSKPIIRGGIVFKSYCMVCHGHKADGDSRAAKLYGSGNLVIRSQTRNYYSKIIRKGGAAVGKSEFMPMWNEELSPEQIDDLLSYLMIVKDSESRGEIVFKTNCILCHGVRGDGKGRASVLFDPPPADLTRSDKNDDYKRLIVTLGGEAMGRNPAMPKWGEQISGHEIDDVLNYIRTLLKANK